MRSSTTQNGQAPALAYPSPLCPMLPSGRLVAEPDLMKPFIDENTIGAPASS